MIAHRRGGRIGNRVTALTDINSSFQRQRCGCSTGKCSNVKQSCCRIVDSLSRTAVECGSRQTGRQQVSQADIGGAIGAIVGDGNAKGDSIAFIGCGVAAE